MVDGASEFGGFEDTTLLRRDIAYWASGKSSHGNNLNEPRVTAELEEHEMLDSSSDQARAATERADMSTERTS